MPQKTFDIGAFGAVYIGARDVTRYCKSFSSSQTIAPQDSTALQAPGAAMNFLAGLEGSALSIAAMLPTSKALVEAEMQKVLGLNRQNEPMLLAPFGAQPGYYGEFLQVEQTKFSPESMSASITKYSADFTGSRGLHRGQVLFASQNPGGAQVSRSEVQTLVFDGAPPDQSYALRAQGTTQTFAFNTGTTNADYGAGIAALPAYAGRTVTVTGPALSGPAEGKSGSKAISFDGQVHVPQLEVVSGAVDGFNVAGGNGNYTLNGKATFTLPITEAALQTNQGAGVVVKGSSSGNTASGEVQRVNGTGNTFTIYDDILVDTATATLASVQTATRAKPGRASVVVSGTITAPVAGTPGNTTVSGAGNGFTNGEYVPTGTFNGAVLRKYVAQSMNVYWSGTNWRIGGDAPGVGSYYYEAPGTAAAGPPASGWTVASGGSGPVPTVTTAATSGAAPGAANLTFTYDAAAGNVVDLATTSAGYTATNTQPGASNASASFKLYYPLAATPVAPTATGTGASTSRQTAPGASPSNAYAQLLQIGGLAGPVNLIGSPTTGTPVDGVNASTNGGFAYLCAPLADAGLNLGATIEHSDNQAGPWSTLGAFGSVTKPGAQIVAIPLGTPVKRWTRLNVGVLTGGSAAVVCALARN